MEKQYIIFFFKIIFNFLFIFNYQYISKIINIYDYPDKIRKFHKQPVPLIGGVIVFVNFIIFFQYLFS